MALAAALLLWGAGACTENQLLAPDMEELEDAQRRFAQADYFPGPDADWQVVPPDELGFDPGLLQEAVDFAIASETEYPEDMRSMLEERFAGLPDQEILGRMKDRGPNNGLVLRYGYIAAEWGPTRRVDMTFSVTKSFLATLAGLALDRGLIEDLDDPVAEYVGAGGYESAHNAPITWHMMLNQTSEWEGTLWGKPDTADRREGRDRELQEPGSFWEYNDVRVNRTAYDLLQVWGEPLPAVLAREVMNPIDATDSWRWHGYGEHSTVEIGGQPVESVSGGGHWGGGLWIASRDQARFGLLHLRDGRWGEEQVLSRRWIEQATTPTAIQPDYGYMWWLNTGQELFPGAPESAFAALGGGDNVIYVDPDNELVVVVRWINRPQRAEFIGKVVASIVR